MEGLKELRETIHEMEEAAKEGNRGEAEQLARKVLDEWNSLPPQAKEALEQHSDAISKIQEAKALARKHHRKSSTSSDTGSSDTGSSTSSSTKTGSTSTETSADNKTSGNKKSGCKTSGAKTSGCKGSGCHGGSTNVHGNHGGQGGHGGKR